MSIDEAIASALLRDVARVAIKLHGPLISERALTELLGEVYAAGHARGAAQRQRELFADQPKRRKKK